MLTEASAHALCKRRSQLRPGDTFFVIVEDDEYDSASDFDLDTYYNGLRLDHILASYRNGERID